MWTFCTSHFICPDIKTFCIEYSSPLPQKDIPNFSIRKNAITWSQCIGPAKATAHLELQSQIFLKICIKNMSLKVFFPIAFILTQSTVSYSFLERLQCKCSGDLPTEPVPLLRRACLCSSAPRALCPDLTATAHLPHCMHFSLCLSSKILLYRHHGWPFNK